jgi:hypothetical protein
VSTTTQSPVTNGAVPAANRTVVTAELRRAVERQDRRRDSRNLPAELARPGSWLPCNAFRYRPGLRSSPQTRVRTHAAGKLSGAGATRAKACRGVSRAEPLTVLTASRARRDQGAAGGYTDEPPF